jgi:hypothetical protein
MSQKLGDNHYTPTVEGAVRHLRLRLHSHGECAALADEASAIRADLRQKSDLWETAVDEARAATADVGYKDAKLDRAVKNELKAALAMMTSNMTAKQREALSAKLFGGKAPSEGMKAIGGPAQSHYVDAILGHLATPEFTALKPQADKITALRADLVAAESNRASRRTAEQVARSALEDSAEAAKRFYNQMQARLTLLFPDDPDFVESCFLDLRGAALEQGTETRKRALLAVYRARYGSAPREVSAALDDDLDEAKFGKYVELFASKSADEIAAALTPSKGPTG